MSRRASAIASVARILRRLPARDTAEDRPDGHAETRQIALAQDVARHDLAAGEQIAARPAVLHQDARLLVHLHAEIGEGDAGPERPGVKGRLVEPLRPVRLLRLEAARAAI